MNIKKHLKTRGINLDSVKVYIDNYLNIATFPLFNLSGQMIGYQQYNPLGSKSQHNSKYGKYYTYISSFHRTMAVWGTETLQWNYKMLFITEGIFDAVKIHNAGYAAIAVMTNNPNKGLKNWLWCLNKNIIAILDNDKAGSKLKNFADSFFTTPDPYKDLGEMPQQEVDIFLRKIAT